MKVYLDTIGCRLNQSEIDTLARQLVANGHEITTDPAVADQIVINTCAVTNQAARDARKMTRRLHRQNEAATITLTGCYATIAPDQITVLPGNPTVVPNHAKNNLIHHLDPAAQDLPVFDLEPIMRDTHGQTGRSRAFIKAQDGCNNRCTFCITTVARGDSLSRPLGDIVAEIQTLSQAGYQEAVLTGVHLGSYGRDLSAQSDLKALTHAILTYTDIPRLRLSSLEPWDIPDNFFSLWDNPRLLPHLHLPLQAGCDATLRRMARRTTQANFRAIVDDARAHIPHLNLTTDIIVGFPGETDDDFATSLNYVADIAFNGLHVFSYSPRPGTAAATMPNHVAKAVKKARTQQMITLGHQLTQQYLTQHHGQTRPVLWESVLQADDNGLLWAGYTDNYLRVNAYGPATLGNTVTPTTLAPHPDDSTMLFGQVGTP
ncbi:MAG TPA: tRNA (N(6)-L-threonylcarbamoyladenosine(37)-C(2))-methylthiotransferase MtaB [Anaerolineae bacterium]|nr:tRNA (N(6)-L-threonylcarbamoyladenosine(37)-C(2))-methylthiotransferase MtaB [Anaerolineae bacterium]